MSKWEIFCDGEFMHAPDENGCFFAPKTGKYTAYFDGKPAGMCYSSYNAINSGDFPGDSAVQLSVFARVGDLIYFNT